MVASKVSGSISGRSSAVAGARVSGSISGGSSAVVPATLAEMQAQASLIDRGKKPISRVSGSISGGSSAVVPATLAEMQAQASLIDRGKKPISRAPVQIQRAAQAQVVTKPKIKGPVETFVETSGMAVFGKQVPGMVTLAGKGGAAQRGLKSFRGAIRGGREFGRAVGGPAGEIVGTAAGGAVGFVGGAFEIGVSTPIRALGGFIQAPGGGGRLLGPAAPIAGQAFELAGEVAGAGAVIKSSPRLAARAAALTTTGREAQIGFSLAREAEPSFRAFTRAEAVGRQAAKVARVAKPVIQSPFVNIPVRTAAAFTAVDVGRRVTRAGAPQEFREFASSQKGAVKIQEGFARIERVQTEKGIVSQIGGGVGLGAVDQRFIELGGLSEKQVSTQFRAAGVPERFIKPAVSEFRATQAGSAAGQVLLGSVTESLGRATIGRTVTRGLAGQVTGEAAKKVTKRAALITAKTVPAFAGLGAAEGVGSFAIAETGVGRIRSARAIPKAIAERPLEFALSGVFGAASAITLGAPVVGFASQRALRGRGFGALAGAKGFETTGFIVDPTEKPGDILAGLFGAPEPSFRVRTVGAVSTLVPVTEPRRGKAKVTVPARTSISLSTLVVQPRPAAPGAPIGTLTPEPILSFIGEPIITPGRAPAQTPILPIQTDVPLQQQISIGTPVAIPISFNVPVTIPESRAPFPLLFPPGRGGLGGKGRGKLPRTRFFNELDFVFGGTLARQRAPGRPKKVSKERRKQIKTIKKARLQSILRFSGQGIFNVKKFKLVR